MSKYFTVITFLLFAFTAGFWVSEKFSKQAIVQAQSSGNNANIQKWEYCAVSPAKYANSNRVGVYWITYFKDSGVQVVEFEDTPTEKNGPAKAIAKLGAEGWELVTQAPLDTRYAQLDALYFKRPKP